MKNKNTELLNNMRLDKWLWCARFYKTRGLASNAIKSGKITFNNEKIKPSKIIRSGDNFKLRKGPYYYEITILKLTRSRIAAAEAKLLYEESSESIQKREEIRLQIKTVDSNFPRTKGRPSKRDRRNLIKFKSFGNSIIKP